METDWAENRAKLPQRHDPQHPGRVLDPLYSTGERDKFRTRLERTADGSTEIYISHRGMEEVYTATRQGATTRLAAAPARPGPEAEFLRRLMVRSAPRSRSRSSRSPRRQAAAGASRNVLDGRPAHAAGGRALRPRLAPRRPGARPRRLHGRGPRPRQGRLLRALRRSRSRRRKEKKGFFVAARFWRSNDKKTRRRALPRGGQGREGRQPGRGAGRTGARRQVGSASRRILSSHDS